MTPEEFIRKHITEKLMAEGFPLTVAQGGAGIGLEHLLHVSGEQEGGSF